MNTADIELVISAIERGLPIAEEIINAITGLINHPAVVASPQLQVLNSAAARITAGTAPEVQPPTLSTTQPVLPVAESVVPVESIVEPTPPLAAPSAPIIVQP